jgi:short subunit dehydrogenase-like uncharacterized protein
MSSDILIYGANGYTAELITRLALEEGATPTLAGRNESKVKAMAEELRFTYRVFGLDDPAEVDEGLADISVVLHCAGPFSRTAQAMAEACIRTKTHYLDITGEIAVFEAMAALGSRAKTAGIMLMPGTGFDVVPSDCLAAHLKSRMPDAVDLELAFQAVGKPSRGTANTMIEGLADGGMIRKDGKMTPVPSAMETRMMDLGRGEVSVMTIPWGDVSTAFYSTGIPNIKVFMAASPGLQKSAKLGRYLGWILNSGFVQAQMKKKIQSGPAGPNDLERSKGESLLWGKVTNAAGDTMESRLRTVEGYTLTALTAWEIAKRCAAGNVTPGFQTPSMAYGADFILEFEGSDRTDI